MTPHAASPDTLLVGIWSAATPAGPHAAAVAALRNWQGDTIADVLAIAGQPWTIIVQALEVAEQCDVGNVVILTNDGALVRALSPPFRPPAPTQTKRIFYSRTEWVDAKWGGDADHWTTLQQLGGRWGGQWRIMQVEELPKARELWQQSQ